MRAHAQAPLPLPELPAFARGDVGRQAPFEAFAEALQRMGGKVGAIDTGTKADCRGALNYGKWRFGCWQKKGHGSVSIHRALVESCDVYFYETGKRVGFGKIHEYAVRLGLGEVTGIALGRERKGLIPHSDWKLETKKSAWFLGETFINSIGQGYVSTTPLQLAVMMCAVANGRAVYKPILSSRTLFRLLFEKWN